MLSRDFQNWANLYFQKQDVNLLLILGTDNAVGTGCRPS